MARRSLVERRGLGPSRGPIFLEPPKLTREKEAAGSFRLFAHNDVLFISDLARSPMKLRDPSGKEIQMQRGQWYAAKDGWSINRSGNWQNLKYDPATRQVAYAFQGGLFTGEESEPVKVISWDEVKARDREGREARRARHVAKMEKVMSPPKQGAPVTSTPSLVPPAPESLPPAAPAELKFFKNVWHDSHEDVSPQHARLRVIGGKLFVNRGDGDVFVQRPGGTPKPLGEESGFELTKGAQFLIGQTKFEVSDFKVENDVPFMRLLVRPPGGSDNAKEFRIFGDEFDKDVVIGRSGTANIRMLTPSDRFAAAVSVSRPSPVPAPVGSIPPQLPGKATTPARPAIIPVATSAEATLKPRFNLTSFAGKKLTEWKKAREARKTKMGVGEPAQPFEPAEEPKPFEAAAAEPVTPTGPTMLDLSGEAPPRTLPRQPGRFAKWYAGQREKMGKAAEVRGKNRAAKDAAIAAEDAAIAAEDAAEEEAIVAEDEARVREKAARKEAKAKKDADKFEAKTLAKAEGRKKLRGKFSAGKQAVLDRLEDNLDLFGRAVRPLERRVAKGVKRAGVLSASAAERVRELGEKYSAKYKNWKQVRNNTVMHKENAFLEMEPVALYTSGAGKLILADVSSTGTNVTPPDGKRITLSGRRDTLSRLHPGFATVKNDEVQLEVGSTFEVGTNAFQVVNFQPGKEVELVGLAGPTRGKRFKLKLNTPEGVATIGLSPKNDLVLTAPRKVLIRNAISAFEREKMPNLKALSSKPELFVALHKLLERTLARGQQLDIVDDFRDADSFFATASKKDARKAIAEALAKLREQEDEVAIGHLATKLPHSARVVPADEGIAAERTQTTGRAPGSALQRPAEGYDEFDDPLRDTTELPARPKADTGGDLNDTNRDLPRVSTTPVVAPLLYPAFEDAVSLRTFLLNHPLHSALKRAAAAGEVSRKDLVQADTQAFLLTPGVLTNPRRQIILNTAARLLTRRGGGAAPALQYLVKALRKARGV